MPHAVFYHLTNSYIKPALKGEVDASETSRRRGCIEVALVYANPSAKPSVCQLPQRGSLLALHYPKAVPACGESGTKCRKGCGSEVAASATSRRRGCIEVALVYANPSGNPPCGVLPAPHKGEPFGYRPPECTRPISRKLSLICLN